MPYQWKVLPFGLATAPRVFTAFTKHILFLCHCKGFHIVIYLDDILVLAHSRRAGKMAHSFLCSILVHLGIHINFSKSDLCLIQTFCFFGVMLGYYPYVSIFASWSISWHSAVSSFLVADPTCYSLFGHILFRQGQFLCQWPLPTVEIVLCHSEWHVECLSLSHPLVFCVHFSFSELHQLEWLSHLQQTPVPLQFPFPDVVIATEAKPIHWTFYFRGLVCHYQLVDPGLVLCVGLILPCRSFRPSPWCCVEWLSTYLVRWLPSIWITALQKLICVIKVVQYLLFFPGWPARYWVWAISMVLLLFQHTFLPISMWRPIICPGVILPQMAQTAFHLWGQSEVNLLASSCTTQCQHCYTLETPLPLAALTLNAFNQPWMFQVSYVFPPPALFPPILSKFLAEHVKS